ncbi:adenylate/guanylate cyclase domain-containing protein [Epibacterium sp. SM1969]|uniref:Adenylate/guanylate cyclase domain-containing protein n=1 Tax=Tritonibacter aquimaris TaxID=2663379 RepID=A0A844AT33_9RHOB|nr:adenylate/guanylate cyclase domain-containing protein [Tritonibacter aquimaris]MQY42468.1 adenylate/guanylate cyclase domain-containing protein [Tritonibacter aquimaris]
MSTPVKRKLTTILAADAERFSTAMEADEMGTYSALKSARSVFFKLIEHHGGRIANTAGDGLIADFPSVVEAAHCAIAVQQELADDDISLRFRIGIHLGDVICDGEDLLGEGVNLAARLQSLAEPGGILISRQVYDQIRNKLSLGFEYLGEQQAKNLPEEISVYRITTSGAVDAAFAKLAPRVDAPRPQPETQTRSRANAQFPPQRGRSEQIWSDDFDSHRPADGPERMRASDTADGPERMRASDTADDTPSDTPGDAPRDLRSRISSLPPHIWLRYGVGGAVAFNLISFGDFGLAWLILVFGLVYGLRNPVRAMGFHSYKSIPARAWVLMLFLICVNLMSFTGPWSIFPVGAIALAHLMRAPRSDDGAPSKSH